ncbi:MAG: hypothetical protein PT944_06480 [Actinomycetaceae bacterium]|nr:hypothetical protein [Actinomycetaceae bacterium]MDY5273015.1 hypothetical protein [Arcanobacterium sp.]
MATSWYGRASELSEDELATISSIWPGSLDLEPQALTIYLTAAASQCEAYAPLLPEGTGIPSAWLLAQILQARALSRAGIIGTDGDILAGTETITVFPMDWTVKRLLNPQHRIGAIA